MRDREREREFVKRDMSVGSEGAEAEEITCAQRFPLHASVERREEGWRPFRDELWCPLLVESEAGFPTSVAG